ncbi:hypothetical protein D9757_003284 [Collybiopsis confluens]|uniref:polynucleotide adenylyltransferase n=1 Tax=Collybiopsis confluens TaxID=2823264 RepID=A0A8H5HYP3_9AGAR|nr:hypothetical protein D9757_003284 [Collybiopsis confluens]
MAAYSPISPTVNQHYRDLGVASSASLRPSKQRFVAELSQCLFDFVIQLLPTQEELAVKEDVRKLLERLIRTIEPDSRLLSFGSTANGFSLRNSDMDLCCLIDSEERLAASDLVTMLGDLLERETKFHVKPLPHARIPIVKLSLDPSPGLPLGIACDIGFENRLALENTRLLMCYAMIDPTRVRTMVLFLKVWSKRRKINSPYKGTLSSYGYVLLVIYFLVHVKNPPVLPNLQQMPPLRPISKKETHLGGYNTWFFDDIDLLRQRWHSDNTETVAELLIDFFRYYSRDFPYNSGVASIRAGILKKEAKGWQSDSTPGRYYNDERNRLCVEDPFETDYNVARCVTKDGLYTIRGEFMRASRVLSGRPERAILALADLCEERKDEDLVSAPPSRQVPPQTPYSVGSRSMRSKGTPLIPSPSTKLYEPGPSLPKQVPARPPPEHMAPKRGQWTSPPPPEAPSSDHTLFENQLGMGLELATAATEAREKEDAYHSSSSSSEILDDEDRRSEAAESDDVTSIRSYTEGIATSAGPSFRRPSWLAQGSSPMRLAPTQVDFSDEPPSRMIPGNRHRFHRFEKPINNLSSGLFEPPKSESMRRSSSSSTRPLFKTHSPLAVSIPLPPSPDITTGPEEPATVYYETRSPHSTYLYPSPGPHSPLSPYHTHHHYYGPVPHDIFPSNLPAISPNFPEGLVDIPSGMSSATGQMTPTLASVSSHNHSHSTSTITSPTPPPSAPTFPSISSNNNNSSNQNVHSSQPTVTISTQPQSRQVSLRGSRAPVLLTEPISKSQSQQLPSLPQLRPVAPRAQNVSSPTTQATHKTHDPQLYSSGNGHGIRITESATHKWNHPVYSGSLPAPTKFGTSPTSSSTGYSTSLSRSPSLRSGSSSPPRSPPLPSPPPPPQPTTMKLNAEERTLGRLEKEAIECLPTFQDGSEEVIEVGGIG